MSKILDFIQNRRKNKKQEEPAVIKQDQMETRINDTPIRIAQTMGPVCNTAMWNPIEKDMLLFVEIPIGFIRDPGQPFKLYVSPDKSGLHIKDDIEHKAAEIELSEDANASVTMKCSVEVIKRMIAGELYVNTIASGFMAVDFLAPEDLNVDYQYKPVDYVRNPTSFTHVNGVLLDDMTGYMCKECLENEDTEIMVTLKVGTPYVVMPDGTIINKDDDPAAFDAAFDGVHTFVLGAPCHVILSLPMEPWS